MIDRQDGIHRYLHATAAGKAILAQLSNCRVEEIIDQHGLPTETDQTITDPEDLFEELEGIGEKSVAYSDGESAEGLRAVGVPVFRPNRFVLGAFSMSAPSNRLQGLRYHEEIPAILLGYANEVELNLRCA